LIGRRERGRVSCFVGNGLLLAFNTWDLRNGLRFWLERLFGRSGFCDMRNARIKKYNS
jgi:hypothetical protein